MYCQSRGGTAVEAVTIERALNLSPRTDVWNRLHIPYRWSSSLAPFNHCRKLLDFTSEMIPVAREISSGGKQIRQAGQGLDSVECKNRFGLAGYNSR